MKHGWVLHNPTKTYKQSITLLRVFNKNHGLNYFSLNYQRGNAYGKEHALPLSRYPINTLGSITYFLTCGGVLCTLTKPPRKPIPSLGYLVIKHHGSTLLEGYYSCSKLHNKTTIPFISYPKNIMGSITYLFKLEGFCITIPKPRTKVILASYCNNILNHETKRYFKKYLFHARYNMPYILIQVNEGIAKFFTLMVKGHLNKVTKFKCNTWIIMGYFHSS